ncbi:MAG: UDP-N-acetylmuramate dehydrogenase [Polyangiaceae bacterium]
MQLERQVPLANRTTLKLGGAARYFVAAQTESDVVEACDFARSNGCPLWILGGGSNIVLPDAGLDGLVLSVAIGGKSLAPSGTLTRLSAGAGEHWDELVAYSVAAGLFGLECLSGIPGHVGATPIQNVGAYGQEVAESLEQVRAFDREQGRFVEIPRAECGFAYRDSRFKSREPGRFVIVSVSFLLSTTPHARPVYPELGRALATLGGQPSLAGTRDAVLELRRSKSMLADPSDPNGRSCGSFFLNPVVSREQADAAEQRLGVTNMPRYPQANGEVKLSAAFLIEHSGMPKGFRSGSVGISSKHALALVCHAGATSQELLAFSEQVQATVEAQCGVRLSPEPQFF